MHYFFTLLIYRLICLFLTPVILLLFVFRSHNHPEYRQRLTERLGILPAHFKKNGIVVHAASVGEIIALKPFIDKLLALYPNTPITITTFTPTGSAQVRKVYAEKVQHCYLPFDIFPCSALFLKALKPKALVLMETELWPNLIAQCAQQKIKLLLINGRLSDRSMKSYQKLNWLITPCLQQIDTILVQSEDNKQNFLALGATKSTCHVAGNLKFDIQINKNLKKKQAQLKDYLPPEKQVWLVASTHPNDEAIILNSFSKIKKNHAQLLLILVPRHPERFEEVYQLCKNNNFSTIKRSKQDSIKHNSDIWLIDTLGELLPLCGLADVVTMGGSFSNIGGHNPLEPALFSKAITVGHDMANFRQVMNQLAQANGIKQLSSHVNSTKEETSQTLANALDELLTNDTLRTELGNNAYRVVSQNQGASQHSLEALQHLIDTNK